MIVSEYLSDIFVGLSEGCFFAQKRVVYLFRGDISDRERATVQFNVPCVGDGSYFIFTH